MQDAAGEPALQQLVLIGLLQRRRQQLGLDEAAVDKKHLLAPAAMAAEGLGDKALHTHVAAAAGDGQQGQGEITSHGGIDGGQQLSVTGGMEHLLPVPQQLKGDVRVAEGQMLHHARHGGALGAVLLHELHAGGGVVKEVTDADGGALRAAGRLRPAGDAALQMEGRAHIRAHGAGEDIHTGHGGDGRQRLAPEAQRADGRQVGGGAQLAGGMAQEGGGQLLRRDPAAVIGDADIGEAAVLDLRRHGRSAGVDGVFQQFFHHAGRTLHHLAGGDEIRHMGRQTLNLRHKGTSLDM